VSFSDTHLGKGELIAATGRRKESRGELQRILYGGRWWLPPSPGRGESSESKVARGLSQHQKGAE
jgi:hypothetical protein